MNARSSKTFASLVAGILAIVLIQPAAARPVQIPERLEWVHGSSDTAAVMDAIATNAHKLPAEFADRLKHRYDDGTIRVMVALSARDDAVESFVRANTSWLRWYGDAPRFLGRINPDQLAALLTSPVVDFVEPDYKITNFMSTSSVDVHARSVANDGTGVWSYKAAAGSLGELVSDVPGLTVEQATGAGVTVAITDSGIDRTHRDFGGWDCTPGPWQPCDSRIEKTVSFDHIIDTGLDPSDSLPTSELASGHGTHVAGTIAGNAFYTRKAGADPVRYGGDGHNFGIAPQANLISLKNGDTIWAGLSSFALQWTLDNADEYGIRASSNSWGCLGGCTFNGSSSTGQLFRDLYRAGVVVVFAAGNDGGTSDGTKLSGNSQSPYVLGVANYDDANDRLASSSSRGLGTAPLPDPATWTPESEPVNGHRRPDLAAPGTSIWSARTLTGGAASGPPRAWIGDADLGTGGYPPYVSMSGTSMATPHVAGAAALLFGACDSAAPLDVMRALMVGADETEVKSTDGSRVAQPYEVGYGALETRAALDWLRGQSVCGGTGGEPTPTESPTTEPTATPTEEPTSACETGPSTTNYFHSETGFGHLDWVEGTTTFDATAPTQEEYSEFYDVWFQNNGTSAQGNGPYDPYWEGSVSQPFDSLNVEFWANTPQGQALGELHFNVAVYVDTTKYVFPMITKEVSPAITNVPARVTASFDKLANGDPFLIDPTGKNVTITIYGQYLADDGFPSIVYDSKDYPSSFTVRKCEAVDPTATPTETPTGTPTETPTEEPPAGRGSYPTEPNDPLFGDQWGMDIINAPQAWQETRATGHGVKIAIVDSGVDLGHPDFRCRKLEVLPGSDVSDGDDDPQDEDGHGTHVAGIAGACTNNGEGVVGVAPDATIMPVRATGGAADLDTSMAAGIKFATDNGAHVINLSIGPVVGESAFGPLLYPKTEDALDYARKAGVVIAAASGNWSFPTCEYPSMSRNVICVSATQQRLEGLVQRPAEQHRPLRPRRSGHRAQRRSSGWSRNVLRRGCRIDLSPLGGFELLLPEGVQRPRRNVDGVAPRRRSRRARLRPSRC